MPPIPTYPSGTTTERLRAPSTRVVVGASAGGIAAVQKILSFLPEHFAAPVLLAQHIQARFGIDFAAVFRHNGSLIVKEGDEKEMPQPGTMYVAPPGYHMLVERDGSLALSVDDPENFARPSIDVLFETAAEAWGAQLIGVLLTGANSDGALGLKAIGARGGTTIVQDPETAEAPTMPRAALDCMAVDHILPLSEIGRFLAKVVGAHDLPI